MRSQLVVRRILLAPAFGLALAAAVTSCSSSTSSSGATGSPSAPAHASAPAGPPSAVAQPPSLEPEPTSGSGATTAITTNWEMFFSGKSPAAMKIALVQNGSNFASIINNQAGSPLSTSATATVSSVTLKSGGTAAVKYSIGVSGASLSGQNGTAVYQDGVWKVGDVSFCALLTLENGGTAPSVCK